MSEHLDNLIVAMLAVGGFSLQRARDILPGLQRDGLTDPEMVREMGEGEVVRRLASCGYDRGAIVTTSLARRLIAAHAAVRGGVLAQTLRLLADGRPEEAEETLRQVKGVGPTVFKTFTALEKAK